jgi:CheY-like chemotaxis protein
VELAQTERFAAILMDALMPGLSGMEATRRIRAQTPVRIARAILPGADKGLCYSHLRIPY